MADSDDDKEFDRRNVREKFRHERNDYDRRDSRSRHDAQERASATSNRSRDRHDGDRGRHDRLGSQPKRDISPPVKRARREVDDGSSYPPSFRVPYGSGGPVHSAPAPPHGAWGHGSGEMHAPHGYPQGPSEGDMLMQPAMMNLKQFIASQDENLTDSEASKRYAEYRDNFRRQQINEFFAQHKDEEWFRTKYHPDEHDKRQEEARTTLKHRCRVFMKLLELGRLSGVSLDIDRTKELVRVLDAAVILMEGGTEFDLKAIDMEVQAVVDSTTPRKRENSDTVRSERKVSLTSEGDLCVTTASAAAPDNTDKLSDKSIDSDDDAHPKFTEPLRLEPETKPSVPVSKPEITADSDQKSTPPTKPAAEKKKSRKQQRSKTENNFDDGSSVSSSDSESSDEGSVHSDEPGEITQASDSKQQTEKDKSIDGNNAASQSGETTSETPAASAEPKPKSLHRTLSIFLRNLAPTITQQEVEAVCKQYPGYLRVALQDPQPERRFSRRGWVTFEGTVNVKEICYNLNQIRLRECDMGAIVNRELQQRIRPVNGLTAHQQVAKSDVKNAAKIVQNFDNRWNMWDEVADSQKPSFGFVSKNPLMKNITDYLVDEGSYEEDILLGEDVESKLESASEVTFERDKDLIQVLDKMILYLRIVYSFDYYSTVEYPHEDAMPHRCGIMHVRGPIPRGKVAQHEISDWLQSFEVRILPFVNLVVMLEDAEVVKLGKKKDEEEIEKFIAANTQELAKDKWLCPLSGKKFKGPEFVRKHILTKHLDKIDELKNDVVYFNTYLADPRRPQLPEHPATRALCNPMPVREGYLPPAPGFHGPPPPSVLPYRPPTVIYPAAPVLYNPPAFHSRGGGSAPDRFRGGMDFQSPREREREPQPRFAPRRDKMRADPRPVISYTDLDAPPDVD